MKKVARGARPPIPPPTFPLAVDLQRLMQQCWQSGPESRPSFNQICAELDRMVNPVALAARHP